MGRRRLSARAERWNTWLTGALLLVLVGLVNRMAARDLHWRRDLSEDQLYALSPATGAILGRLEDRLLVKTYFTEKVRSGDVLLAKARIEAQLAELGALAGARLDVVHVDPSASTAALQEARNYGVEPRRIQTTQGTQQVSQPVYLGMLLRYRGREEVIPWADPWGFEVQFASAVYALLSDRTLRIGWYEHPEAVLTNTDPYFSTYQAARALIARRAELVEVPNLRDGDPKDVLDDLDVLFVVRPREEHPRAAFEIEQLVQRGGRVVFLIDQADYNVIHRGARPSTTGEAPPRSLGALEDVLVKWRALPLPYHVWDMEGETDFAWVRPAPGGQEWETVPSRSPALVTIGPEGFERAHSITAGLQRATLAWAQPLPLAEIAPPEGVVRVDLLSTSADAYVDEVRDQLVHTPERIASIRELLLGAKDPRRIPLAAAFSGDFPAAFDRAPAPWDPILDDDPKAQVRYCDDPVAGGGAQGSIIVFGDADWLRDDQTRSTYPFLNASGNTTLLMNVIDWLSLDEDLIALRRKNPIERRLRDFEREAQVELGVYRTHPADTDAEARRQQELRDEARARARAQEWRRMVLPVLVTLALVLGFGLAWNLRERRRGGA